jgi:hypothetical protein
LTVEDSLLGKCRSRAGSTDVHRDRLISSQGDDYTQNAWS